MSALGEGFAALAEEAERLSAELRDLRVATRPDRAALRDEVERAFPLEGPVPLRRLVGEAARILRVHAVHVVHPRYFGLYNPSVREASVLGDALAALYNPQLAVWAHAPGAAELEQHALRRLASALGRDGDAAHFTSGGSEANLTAVLCALAHLAPGWEAGGVRALRARPAIYASREAHHSLMKVARMTGLGGEALREVPVDARLALCVPALEARLAGDRAAGFSPMAVVGTAGTTSAGVVDPLPALAELSARQGVWFHVDAAYGGAAALVPRLRGTLTGIERADSVTFDAHKGLSVPMGAGMFFCRHPEALRRAFAVTATYMPSADAAEPYTSTVEWSRRTIGLKVLFALAESGLAGAGALFDEQCRMGDLLRDRLRRAGYTLVNDTPLPVVCFRHPDLAAGRLTAAALCARVVGRGRAWISEVILDGRLEALRACITSHLTREADLDLLLEELEAARTA